MIWDKKYYLERNQCLPEEPGAESQEPGLEPACLSGRLPTLDDAGQYQLAYEKRRLIDLRSKLKRKLLNPKAKPGKLYKWETELAQCALKI